MYDKYVNMEQVIGNIAIEYNIPLLKFDELVYLCKKTVIVFNLDQQAKKIPFTTLCDYVKLFIQTPFGKKILEQIIDNQLQTR